MGAALLILLACSGPESPPSSPTAAPHSPAVGNSGCATTLCCPDCELISVLSVENGELVQTEAGPLRMYGAYVDPQGETCAAQADQRMRELVNEELRIEPVDGREFDSRGRRVAYLFTTGGDSIDELMVREGLARAWSQDGQHRGWFVYRQSVAAAEDDGCIWSLGPLGR